MNQWSLCRLLSPGSEQMVILSSFQLWMNNKNGPCYFLFQEAMKIEGRLNDGQLFFDGQLFLPDNCFVGQLLVLSFRVILVPANLVLVDDFGTPVPQCILPKATVIWVSASFGATTLVPRLTGPSSLLRCSPSRQVAPTSLSGVTKAISLVVAPVVPIIRSF